jgi:hypothetical protein
VSTTEDNPFLVGVEIPPSALEDEVWRPRAISRIGQRDEYLLLGISDGRRLLGWARGKKFVAPIEIYVSTREYTNRIEPQWLQITRVLVGDASPYPVQAQTIDRGAGQWSFDQVIAVRVRDNYANELRDHPDFPWPTFGSPKP